ncbi:acyltransferase family protein [Cohnella sp. AR92]|uniref:acyltransferase family protein n=1 Tax=Cohnella sp. AR92 TaxID=648716 RepID=UPI000F8F5C4B|nr:acyltransferase family protein [Cohnella sp. AR92]RUS46184.1 acetyltransferase [Cohnella sp. AR92]
MPEHSSKKRYMTGLDGLRALSVLAVIVYHLPMNVLPGGFLGVGVFFVLSGYLITDQLVAKWQKERTLDLKGFWLRRARRLLPAVLLLIATVAAWLAATDPERLRSLGGDIVASLAYVNNWWLIFHNVSYFDSFGPPSPFGHFWSLAVEEQFYVLWPLLMALGLIVAPKRGYLALLICGGAAASAIAMAMIYVPGTDPSRVYYGTDTRAFGLLIGAALAVILPSARMNPISSSKLRFLMDAAGSAALTLIVFMAIYTDEYSPFAYRGGLVLLSLASAAVIAVIAHPSSRLGQALSIKPLRWIGIRSYGIYLWHYPVIVLTSPSNQAEPTSPATVALQIALTLVLAALSWRFVEKPILNGGLGRLGRSVAAIFRGNGASRRAVRPRLFSMAAVSLVFVLCISCGGGGEAASGRITNAAEPSPGQSDKGKDIHQSGPATGQESSESPNASDSDSDVILAGEKNPSSTSPSSNGDKTVGTKVPSTNGSNGTHGENGGSKGTGNSGEKPSSESVQETGDGKGVTVIGDSVILGVQPYLEKRLPGILVDGKVGRQMNKAMETVAAHEDAGDLGDVVILELGTNGSFTEKKLTQLLDEIGSKRTILLINTRVPRQWQDTVNKTLKDVAADYDNVSVIDWYRASAGHSAFFGKDGVHLTKTGAEFYTDMIADALKNVRGGH